MPAYVIETPDYETHADGDSFEAYINVGELHMRTKVSNDFGEILIDGEHFAGLDEARALAIAILALTDPETADEIAAAAREHGAEMRDAEIMGSTWRG